jgi:molybdenum cofactor cytidylyltransferase
MPISCVVLAGGTSSRLGSPKQLLDLGGKPVLQHVLDRVAGTVCDEIIVVLGHEAERIASAIELPRGARVLMNDRFAEGQSTSLLAGLGAVDDSADAALIVLGDQPRLPAEVFEAVVGAWDEGVDVVRPLYDGRPGHPVLIARRAFANLGTLTGDTGARAIVDAVDVEVRDVNLPGPAPVDIDTREDYETLRRGGDG